MSTKPKQPQSINCRICGYETREHVNGVCKDCWEKGAHLNPSSTLKPPFSEDTMRLALSRLASVAPLIQGNADDDDPVAILQGAIDELLIHRQVIDKRRNFDKLWLQETERK